MLSFVRAHAPTLRYFLFFLLFLDLAFLFSWPEAINNAQQAMETGSFDSRMFWVFATGLVRKMFLEFPIHFGWLPLMFWFRRDFFVYKLFFGAIYTWWTISAGWDIHRQFHGINVDLDINDVNTIGFVQMFAIFSA